MPNKTKPQDPHADLPGCIRREISKIRNEERKHKLPPLGEDSVVLVAWRRWGKRQKTNDLVDAVILVMHHAVKDNTVLHARLLEAALRLSKMDKTHP